MVSHWSAQCKGQPVKGLSLLCSLDDACKKGNIMFVTCYFTVTPVCLSSVLLLVQYATHYGHYVSVFPLWTLVEKTSMSNHSQTATLQKTAHLARCLQLPARVLDLVVGRSKRFEGNQTPGWGCDHLPERSLSAPYDITRLAGMPLLHAS